uniref:Anaphase-promoting complex subunit 4 WD40 domain-containing protein n=1 Tax=Leersia perrieri TaxID=77586 RepID=A0A0D9X2R8_9ORYZ
MTATSSAAAGESSPPPLVNLGFNPSSTSFLAATATSLRVFSCFNSLHKVKDKDIVNVEISNNGGGGGGGWEVSMADIYNEAFAAVVFRRREHAVDGSITGFTDKICFWVVPNGRMYQMGKDLPFDGAVRGIRLTGEYMAVAGDDRTALYEIPHHGSPPKKVKVVETAANPLGLAAVAQPDGNARFVMVSPQKMKGMLQVHRLGEDHVYVRAHCSAVAAFEISADGRLLATAGKKGTLVRVFDTTDGKVLQEWRCCDTLNLCGLYEEKCNAKPGEITAAAAGDGLHDQINRSTTTTCAVARRVAADDARFVVKRFRPGSHNYESHYDSEQINVDAGDVKAVHVHRDKTVVVHARRIDVFGVGVDGAGKEKAAAAAVLQKRVETGENPGGVCAVSPCSAFAFACPGKNAGELRVERWAGDGFAPPLDVAAHRSCLAGIALSWDGLLVATASVKGTILRVFRVADGVLLQEASVDRADIHSIVFSSDSKWLAVSSDKGTVHVFDINVELGSTSKTSGQDASESPTSKSANQGYLSYMKGYVLPKYFKSEKSFAQFHLPKSNRYLVAFGTQPNTVLIIGMDGNFYRCQFDPIEPGEMKQIEYTNFLHM